MIQTQENNFKRSLGLRIMVQRQKIKMSQKELGARIGVSGQQLQKYENGLNSMSAHKLSLCAEILKKPVGYFYGDDEDDPSSAASHMLRMAEELGPLPEEGIDMIVDMARYITRMTLLCAEVDRKKQNA